MVDLALDLDKASGTFKDLLIVNNDLALTSDAYPAGQAPAQCPNPVLQDCLQRLSMFLGEWFLDNTQGTPWFQQILVKNPDQSKVDAILLNILADTIGVTQVNDYSFTINSQFRTLTVNFSLQTTSGPVDYTGTLTGA